MVNNVVDIIFENIVIQYIPTPIIKFNYRSNIYKILSFADCDQFNDFIDDICDNIEQYSKSRDIIKLLTHINKSSKPPLLVSTLTKKLYIRPSFHRGIHFEIYQHHMRIKNLQEDIESKLEGVLSFQENNLLKATTSRSTPSVAKTANRRSCEIAGVKVDAPRGTERRRKSDTSSLKRDFKRKTPAPWR